MNNTITEHKPLVFVSIGDTGRGVMVDSDTALVLSIKKDLKALKDAKRDADTRRNLPYTFKNGGNQLAGWQGNAWYKGVADKSPEAVRASIQEAMRVEKSEFLMGKLRSMWAEAVKI